MSFSILQKVDGSATVVNNITGTIVGYLDADGGVNWGPSGLITLTADISLTADTHEGRVLLLGEVGGNAELVATLPEATGSGAIFRFIVSVVNTSNYVIATADATNAAFFGSVNIIDLDAAAQAAYAPAATDDLITLNGGTTGGAIGDYLEVIDFATDKWMVNGQLQCPTGSNPATPFSGT